ncbi:CoA transferase [Streptomyces thioluteus]|uniref:CoA transferase n=1 Tax=Streptomyces thioluteus TaxID=66431 RepID=UPI003CD076C3
MPRSTHLRSPAPSDTPTPQEAPQDVREAERPSGRGLLAGVRVIELAGVIMAPYAAKELGDLGADVIKVEPPTGDMTRHYPPRRHPGMGGPAHQPEPQHSAAPPSTSEADPRTPRRPARPAAQPPTSSSPTCVRRPCRSSASATTRPRPSTPA